MIITLLISHFVYMTFIMLHMMASPLLRHMIFIADDIDLFLYSHDIDMSLGIIELLLHDYWLSEPLHFS